LKKGKRIRLTRFCPTAKYEREVPPGPLERKGRGDPPRFKPESRVEVAAQLCGTAAGRHNGSCFDRFPVLLVRFDRFLMMSRTEAPAHATTAFG